MTSHEPDELSEREREILRLVATGASNKEIAHQLVISPNTVKVHLRNIFAKIGAASRTEAAMYAVRVGISPTATAPVVAAEETGISMLPMATVVPDSAVPYEAPPVMEAPRARRTWLFWLGIALLAILGVGIVLLRQTWLPIIPVLTAEVGSTPTSSDIANSWTRFASLPTARSGLAVVSYNNLIFVIGGDTGESVTGANECLDQATNTWLTRQPKPLAVTDIQAALIGGKLYIPGGQAADGKPTNLLEIYDPTNDTWEAGPPMPEARSAYGMAVYEGTLYLFGGWNGQAFVSEVFSYQPATQEWQALEPMPTARGFASAAVLGDKISVLGGFDGSNSLTTHEIFQPNLQASQPWISAPDLPTPRHAMGVATVTDTIYLVGGQTLPAIEGNDRPEILVYLGTAQAWQGAPEPPARLGSKGGSTSLGRQIFIIGGELDGQRSSQSLALQAFYTVLVPILK